MAFSFRVGTNWCHDFPKLARESGFYFNMHGRRVRVDWNRISAIDIDRVIRERDFLTIDANINNVIDYCLESEYDVKILDPNFVKLFRLAQLSVEYLLYCKQYLDHSVVILKDELKQKIEQNVSMKKEIATLEDTLKSLKERSREKRKLIETNFGEISNGEIYKCPHCPKTFVRAIFVNSHIARKHSYLSDIGVVTSPVHEHYRAETEKLHNEIKTLKERLNQTERVIRRESDSDKILDNTGKMYINNINKGELDKVFQEQRRYQEDIGNLKSILFDEIRALKEKDHTANENILETNVKTLISQQDKEIESLRNQLLERVTPDVENMQVKLQTQENYWKAKIEDMETAHHRDIERLTAELKVTQQVADRLKSEYAVKVHDLEKQSMDQSNILVEQRKQLNSLSREISNSQTQINNYRTREKDKAEKFHQSPLLKIKRDGSHNNNSETYRKSSNSEMVIEDIGSEGSQEYSDKSIAIQSKYIPNKNTAESENNRKLTDLSRTTEHVTAMSNLKNFERLNVRKTNDKPKYHNTLDNENEIIDYTNKSFTVKENIPTNVYKKYADNRNVERKKILHSNDMRNSKNSKFLEKHRTITSTTESASSSSVSESESESEIESVTVDNNVMMKRHETSAVKSSNTKNISIQEEVQIMFDNRLRELGIDPEWRGIPAVTFKQKMEIVKHQQNINTKKLARYAQIKQTILDDLFQKISTSHKESKYTMLTKHSPLKLITHTRSKALKAFSDHKNDDEYTSVQKTENTTPSKLRLKQKIELLPKKYKDNEAFENTHESPLKRNGIDGSSPKVTSTYPRLVRSISSSSSIETQEDIKPISSTKIIVSDSASRKISSPISSKQVLASKLAENNDFDSTIVRQDDSILSPTNNKSVLKPITGSVSSLIKKKVLFDLENRKDFDGATIPENDEKTHQISDNDWNISSFPERDEYALHRQKSMSTGNIILKTSQSDKIAEISKKIQEQLSIARKPPVGSVETIFRSNMNLQDLTNYNANKQLLSPSLTSAVSESSMPNFTSINTKGGVFPQPAPRTRKDKDLVAIPREHELKYSDLDSDIDEILQME